MGVSGRQLAAPAELDDDPDDDGDDDAELEDDEEDDDVADDAEAPASAFLPPLSAVLLVVAAVSDLRESLR